MTKNVQDSLKEIKESIYQVFPKKEDITEIEFEGPEIAVYTKNPKGLLDDDSLVKSIAKKIRKRIVTRSDPSIRIPQEETIRRIRKLVPEEAEISSIEFDDNVGEVIVEAHKPGLVIGRNGVTLKEIIKETSWRPKVIRTPPMKSKIISTIRSIMNDESDKRKKYMRIIGKRIHRSILKEPENVRLTSLGGFREVGKMGILIRTEESNVLIDCGVKVGSTRGSTFPAFDLGEFDIDKLDAVIITHAHLDHSGAVPYLYKYGYEGPIYTTEATRNLMTLLQLDYLDVAEREGKLVPYSQKDVKKCIMHTLTLGYGEVTDIAPDVKLTLHNAGHILGSAIVHLHIGNGLYNLAYTGDFKYRRSRLLESAVSSFPRLETMIMESTYGLPNDLMPSLKAAEKKITDIINETIDRGGKVMIPVLAVGRAQEIKLVIEDGMTKGFIRKVPIYVDGMITEATAIHTTHPELLNHQLRERIFHRSDNPFLADYFIQVENRQARQEIVHGDPCIIMATSGMLTGGPILDYFSNLGDDDRNSIIFVSYQAEGTLGRRVQKGWREVPVRNGSGKTINLNVKLQIETVEGFSGHSDRRELMNYAMRLQPRPERIIFVHGEEKKCINLASSIHRKSRIETRVPYNLETIRLR
ncbi:MAG: beta-CASP ribonuclease aCPSF1 [Candidatus Ranarchaeia archaeon]